MGVIFWVGFGDALVVMSGGWGWGAVFGGCVEDCGVAMSDWVPS